MKKKIVILLIILCSVIGAVSAKENDTKVRVDYLQNVYGNFVIGDLFYWNQIGITYANDKLAYCLEPGKWITESTYDSYTDFSIKDLDQKDKEYLELVAYYGYQLKGHETTKYYLATQELIWRYLGLKEIYWTTRAEHKGERIDVEKEKNEIKRLMSQHANRPSFHGQTYQVTLGKKYDLVDNNHVLQDYGLILPIELDAKINNNRVYFTANKLGNFTLSFLRYPHAYQASFLYTKNDSQALGTFGLSSRVEANVHIEVKGFQLTLHKKDKDNNSNIPSGEGSLEGAIYEITGNNGYYNTMKTDKNGVAILKNLPVGKYQVKEIKPSEGYLLDDKVYHIVLDKDEKLEVDMDVLEKVITNKIKLIKVFSDGETGIVKPEVKIHFGIYRKDGTLLKEVVTDTYGTVEFILPYGTYTVKQLNTLPNYEKVKDFEIKVTEENKETFQYVLHDKLIESKIKIKKVDENGNSIKKSGVTFKIKNVDTNEYVKQKITYPKEEIIDEFKTNEKGEILLPEPLPAGNYALEEKEAPTGYYLLKEPILFTLNENTEYEETEDGLLYTILATNHPQKGNVIIEKLGKIKTLEQTEDGTYETKEITKPLSGVKFRLYANEEIKENGTLIYHNKEQVEVIETKDGLGKSKELPLGSYCVKEIESIEDYLIDPKEYCFTLTPKKNETEVQVKSFQFVNETPHTKIELIKEKEEMTSIENQQGKYEFKPFSEIEFGIYNQQPIIIDGKEIGANTLLMKERTDKEGKIRFENLPFGIYRIKELTAKEEYRKLEDITVLLTKNQLLQTVNVKNEKKKGSMMIVKEDDTGKTLTGAEFILSNSQGKKLFQGAVNENGILQLDNLEYGMYYLEETKAPTGYHRMKKKIKVEIKEDEVVEKVVVKNSKMLLPDTSSLTKTIQFWLTIGFVCIFGFFLIAYLIRNHG